MVGDAGTKQSKLLATGVLYPARAPATWVKWRDFAKTDALTISIYTIGFDLLTSHSSWMGVY
eukprot:m.104976 g.104976  ORF g.104976 m.104976 type:complete len:62 (-) comp12625_c1_seq1:198-383(-)